MKHSAIAALILATVLSGVAFSASATTVQGFNDVYTVQNGTILAKSVLSGELTLTQNDAQSLTVSEPTGVLAGGVFTVTAGQDETNNCVVTIQDVDFNQPVLVKTSCTAGYSASLQDNGYNNANIVIKHS